MKKNILNKLFEIYAYIFGRVMFYKVNLFMYHLSLRGLGILNYTGQLSGEKKWLKNYLGASKTITVIDVGANLGKYSQYILEINPHANIIAFEPHPKTFSALTERIKCDNFKAYNLGVSDVEGILNLYDYGEGEGSEHATIYSEVLRDIHKAKTIKQHAIKVVSLDKFLTDNNLDFIDLLKIDTEGNEYNVIKGLKNYILSNRIRCIHFEFNEMNIVSKSSFKNFWDILEKKI